MPADDRSRKLHSGTFRQEIRGGFAEGKLSPSLTSRSLASNGIEVGVAARRDTSVLLLLDKSPFSIVPAAVVNAVNAPLLSDHSLTA